MKIREANREDLEQIRDIYAYYVENSTATFEFNVPSLEEMGSRFDKWLSALIAEENGEVLGYAYSALYNSRQGYKYTVEETVYVRPGLSGKGIGRDLLKKNMQICKDNGMKQMIALIGGESEASIKLHERLGFVKAGILKNVGYKHDRWLDSIIMQYSFD